MDKKKTPLLVIVTANNSHYQVELLYTRTEKPYHFSNEMNMLLQIAAGKSAKQLKAERNLSG
jgi:hypothetical protein